MSAVTKLEKQIGGLFKGAPALPENGKEGLVKAWPWIALIFGVLQLLAAWGLWELTRRSERLIDTLSMYYTNGSYGLSSFDKTMVYVGIVVLLVDAVILGYSIVTLFIDDRGVGSFIFSLLTSAIGFYLLFQVREKYKSAGGAKKPAAKS